MINKEKFDQLSRDDIVILARSVGILENEVVGGEFSNSDANTFDEVYDALNRCWTMSNQQEANQFVGVVSKLQ